MIRREYGWGLGVILVAVLISCFALPGAWAEEEQGAGVYGQQVGKIERTQGTTIVNRGGQAEFEPINKDDPVFISDIIGTEPSDTNAKMWWRHPSPLQMDASLGRDSLLGFEAYSQEGPASSFVGSATRGMIRFIRKVPVTQPESSFTTTSPTALIQVIPTDQAADYVVSVLDDEHTSVTVIWGEVVVKNISDQVTQTRYVTSCQMVMVEKDKEPSEVMPVGSDTLRELIRQTTIPGTLPRNVPSCEPPAEPVPPDEYIPPEFPEPEPIEGLVPEEPGDGGPPGFVPIPIPPGTIDTIDTTTTETTTPTDPTTTGTVTLTETVTFTLPTFTFTFPTPTDTSTITWVPPTFTFTIPSDTGTVLTITGLPTFTIPSDTGTEVTFTGLPTFTFTPPDTGTELTFTLPTFTIPTVTETPIVLPSGDAPTNRPDVGTEITFTGLPTLTGIATVSTGGGPHTIATFHTGGGTHTGGGPHTGQGDRLMHELNRERHQLHQQLHHEQHGQPRQRHPR